MTLINVVIISLHSNLIDIFHRRKTAMSDSDVLEVADLNRNNWLNVN